MKSGIVPVKANKEIWNDFSAEKKELSFDLINTSLQQLSLLKEVCFCGIESLE